MLSLDRGLPEDTTCPLCSSCVVAHCLPPPGLALLGFLVLLPMTMPWGQLGKDGWLGGTHCVACLAPPAGSVLYHLFMCHQGGSAVYTRLLALDMCGVCLVNTLGEPRDGVGWFEGWEPVGRGWRQGSLT